MTLLELGPQPIRRYVLEAFRDNPEGFKYQQQFLPRCGEQSWSPGNPCPACMLLEESSAA